jgi:hypothetical protein
VRCVEIRRNWRRTWRIEFRDKQFVRPGFGGNVELGHLERGRRDDQRILG